MKLRKSLFMCATLVVAVCAYRCSDDKIEDMEQAEVQMTDLEKIERLGLSTDGIRQEGENYIVEGDICITPEFLKEQDFSNLKQARSKSIVSCNNAKSIKIKINYKESSTPYKRIASAIKKWNDLKDDQLNFEIVTSKQDITIKSFSPKIMFKAKKRKISGKNLEVGNYDYDFSTGQAGFPSGGKPFGTVKFHDNLKERLKKKVTDLEKEIKKEARDNKLKKINNVLIADWSIKKDYPEIYDRIEQLTDKNQVATIMHELGHCVGLWHTNWEKIHKDDKGIHIPDTKKEDKESIMNGNSATFLKPTFTSNDKKAIKALYKDKDALCKEHGK